MKIVITMRPSSDIDTYTIPYAKKYHIKDGFIFAYFDDIEPTIGVNLKSVERFFTIKDDENKKT